MKDCRGCRHLTFSNFDHICQKLGTWVFTSPYHGEQILRDPICILKKLFEPKPK